MDFAAFALNVGRLIRDDAGVLATADLEFFISEAVRRYSRVRPRVVVADVPGDGSFDYSVPAPFDPDFSRLELVEHPAGRREPEYVDRLDWRLYDDPAGTVLRFRVATPKADETIRLTFTAMHTVDAAGTTVPDSDHDAINLIAAALACEALASHYSSAGDSTIQADSVDHRSKAAEYAARAKRFRSMADELVPLPGEDDVRPAGGEVSLAPEADFLSHRER